MAKFYSQIYAAILKHVDFDKIKVIILGSPGFFKDELFDFIFAQAAKESNRLLLDSKKKFLKAHCSSGHKAALQEMFQDPGIQRQLSTTKFTKQIERMDLFYSILHHNPHKAYYGLKHVTMAHEEYSAISTLLITDELMRSSDVPTRRKFIALVDQVESANGEVVVFSTSHPSGIRNYIPKY